MYDINVKKVGKGKNIYLALLIVVIFFLVLMVLNVRASIIKFNSLDSTIMSTGVGFDSRRDTGGEEKYSAIYYYEVNGREYSCHSNAYSTSKPNSNKNIYYDSTDPARCMIENDNSLMLLIIVVFVLAIIFLVFNIKKVNKRVKTIEELNKSGKLVKNLPYRLEDTGIVVNGAAIQRIVIEYILPSGCLVTLRGDPIYDRENVRNSSFVDLVIDEKNSDNYYIDFEINRLTGNLPQDYFNQNLNNQNQFGEVVQQEQEIVKTNFYN